MSSVTEASPAAAASSVLPHAGAAASWRPEQTIGALRYGSLAILGGYTLSLCYRAGLFRRALPAHVNARLEQVVERVKAKTEPIGNVKRYALARDHLLRAYGWAFSGMGAVAAGALLFRTAPHLPIALPLAATAVCSLIVVGVPRTVVLPAARVGCFYTAMLSAGYCFGPLAWAAQDSLVVYVLLTGCTMTGLCVPLCLTRGMVSYVCSAQALSLALSLSLVTAPKHSAAYSPFSALKAQPGVQVVLNGDVNVLLTMQLIMNLGINLLHTLPTIYRYVSWTESDAALEAAVDPLREAFCICAGWGYVMHRLVRSIARRLVRRVVADNTQDGGSRAGGAAEWAVAANGGSGAYAGVGRHGKNVDIASDVTAGVVSLLWYVRAISILQHGNPEATLERARTVCAKISPIAILLGGNSVYMSAPAS